MQNIPPHITLVWVIPPLVCCVLFGWYAALVEIPQVRSWSDVGTVFFVCDSMSWWFLLYLGVIVFSVFSFSMYYLTEVRFLMWLGGFALSMVFLVLGSSVNFYSFLIGWDWLGVTSFWLILYYSNSAMSAYSGLKTYAYNRLGDGLFLLAAGLFYKNCFKTLGSVEFSLVVGVVFFWGCCTKSALFPFSSWLPFAMAAPTPVSALVHSSTLVTAGLYVLLRSNCFPSSLWLWVGLLTFTMGGWSSYTESDSKKAVAYSTLSQLGLMLVVYYFTGDAALLLIYMLGHAVVKAGLFIAVGLQLNSMAHTQDQRFMRSSGANPAVDFLLCFCAISLAGFPFSFMYLFKDALFSTLSFGSGFMFVMVFFLVGVSEAYSIQFLLGNYKAETSGVTYQISMKYKSTPFFFLFFLMFMGVGVLSFSTCENWGAVKFMVGMVFLWVYVFFSTRDKQVNAVSSGLFGQHAVSVVQVWDMGEILYSQEEMVFGGEVPPLSSAYTQVKVNFFFVAVSFFCLMLVW